MMLDPDHAPAEPGGARAFCPQARRRFVLIAAILASSMAFIDGSVVSIALPAIRADLGASLADGQWINNGYLLFLTALMLLGGAVGDRFGLRLVFGAGIAGFTLASAGCALAPGPGVLIAMRALQGLAAAFMVPGSLAIIAKAYPRDERGRAIGIWAAASSLTTLCGPVVGGVILSVFGDAAWRLVFAINLPLGAVALVCLFGLVPADARGPHKRLDTVGGLAATAALFLIAFGLTGDAAHGSVPETGRAMLFGGAGLVMLALFLFAEDRTREPMMPLGLFANAGFSGANGLTFALYFALGTISFFLPMLLIGGWGVSAAEVALMFAPIGASIAILSRFTGGATDRFGPAPLIAGGSALVGLALFALVLVLPTGKVWGAVFPAMIALGAGMGLVVSPLSTAVMTSVEDSQTGIASGVNNAISRLAGLIAVAALGGAVAYVFDANLGVAAARDLAFGVAPEGTLAPRLEAARVTASNRAFAVAALVAGGMALISAVVAWRTLEHRWREAPTPEG